MSCSEIPALESVLPLGAVVLREQDRPALALSDAATVSAALEHADDREPEHVAVHARLVWRTETVSDAERGRIERFVYRRCQRLAESSP